ncbi:MAG: formyltetrahydrofolate deformylase [Wolinella sp.]
MKKYILSICSPDSMGLIYKIASVIFQHGLNIDKTDEYVDMEQQRFFMRAELSGEGDIRGMQEEISRALMAQAIIKLEAVRPKDIVLLCTKENHCLGDLLLRYESGELEANIKAVISNYDHLRALSEKFEIPFYGISHEGISREEHEENILACLEGIAPDFLVLAKYMRILSPQFVRHYEQRIINIHHSFLPAFIGANPYKQAYERGVKIIGATAHFVNDNLDEGPIIMQDIIKIDHTYTWRDMQKAGRDVEKVVLARALNLALHDRIFVHGNKTVIF